MSKNDKPKHTPTPWRASQNGDGIRIDGDDGLEYVANIHPHHITASGREVLTKTQHENADFIVRAVNSHADLLEVVKAALPLLIRLGDFIGNVEGRCEVILKVRAAIAKAEGK